MSEGFHFGRYRLLRRIAVGGMAEIFLARHEGPGGFAKTVVVKRVLPHLADNPTLVQMFLDEARIASQFSHPNVVQVFDFGQEGGTYYLAMEYVQGENLQTLMRAARNAKRAIPLDIACRLVTPICAGLHHAHTLTDSSGNSLKVVHRDISPVNIMVSFSGVVKVVDFGIARAEGRLQQTRTGVIKGKFHYMSPEQVLAKDLDARSDVFAIGIVLHELLTGQKLFVRENQLETARAILTDEIPSPGSLRMGVPNELDAIVMRALSRDPEHRYGSAKALRKDLLGLFDAGVMLASGIEIEEYIRDLLGDERVLARQAQANTDPEFTIPEEGVARPTPTTDGDQALEAEAETRLKQRRTREVTRPLPDEGTGLQIRAALGWREALGRVPAVEWWVVGIILLLGGLGLLFVLMPRGEGPALPVSTEVARATVAAPEARPARVPTEPASVPTPIETAVAPAPEARPPVATRPRRTRQPRTPVARPAPLTPPPLPAVETVAPTYGTLEVNCIPWCRIYIDGVDSELNSPARGIRLTAGRHLVRVTNPPSGKESQRSVTISQDRVTREAFRF